MENIALYLIKSMALIALFYGCYRLLLSRETFFQSNRGFLLLGLFTAFLLPLYYITQVVLVNPVTITLSNETMAPVVAAVTETDINWWSIIGICYLIGVGLLALRFTIQLFSLASLIRNGSQTKKDDLILVKTKRETSPFSFFNCIVYNPSMYSETELQTVIEHEMVHVRQRHSIDILLMHLLCIVQWFNPFAWAYKNMVSQNLEYIADHKVSQLLNNKKEYQYLLLNQSADEPLNFTVINPFFNSLIKKRILMLNAQKSKKVNRFKFGLVLPFLALFLFTINTRSIAQSEKNPASQKSEVNNNNAKFSLIITKNSTNAELREQAAYFLERDQIDLQFTDIQRNANGEIIAINSTFESAIGSGTYSAKKSGEKPIKSFEFHISYDKLKGERKVLEIGYSAVREVKGYGLNTGTIATEIQENGELSELTKSQINNAVQEQIEEQPIIAVETSLTTTIEAIDIDNLAKKEIWSKSHLENIDKPIYVIDGKVQAPNYFNHLAPDKIKSMIVLKGQFAIDKYGTKGQNGVIEVITTDQISEQQQSPWKVTGVKVKDITDENDYLMLTKLLNGKIINPLIIVDGIEMGKDLSEIKIKLIDIEQTRVSQPGEATTKEYGIKGKDGVIEITTKKGKH